MKSCCSILPPDTRYPAPGRFGPTCGGHRGRRYGPKVAGPVRQDQGGKGVKQRLFGCSFVYACTRRGGYEYRSCRAVRLGHFVPTRRLAQGRQAAPDGSELHTTIQAYNVCNNIQYVTCGCALSLAHVAATCSYMCTTCALHAHHNACRLSSVLE